MQSNRRIRELTTTLQLQGWVELYYPDHAIRLFRTTTGWRRSDTSQEYSSAHACVAAVVTMYPEVVSP